EVLLFEPETLTFICGIVGVQYPGDRLRFILGLYGINVIPFIKSPEIELLYRFGTPESESIDRLSAVSDYRHVIWYRLYLVFSTEFDNDRIIAVFDEPGVFVFQPWISLFDLEAVDEVLFEYAVLVQYSVSRKRVVERQRVLIVCPPYPTTGMSYGTASTLSSPLNSTMTVSLLSLTSQGFSYSSHGSPSSTWKPLTKFCLNMPYWYSIPYPESG